MADIVTRGWVKEVRIRGAARCGGLDGSVLTALCDSWLALRAESDVHAAEARDMEVLRIAVRRLTAENGRLQDGLRRVCNLIWPYRGEHDARRAIAESEAIRKNLVDGRTWDGKPAGETGAG